MARMDRVFYVILKQKRPSDIELMQYLKTSFTGQAKAAFCGLGVSSQLCYFSLRKFLAKK